MNITDDQIAWFEQYAAQYAEDIYADINAGEIVGEDIEIAKLEVKTFNEIKNLLNETRKVRSFDGWETIVPTLPMH